MKYNTFVPLGPGGLKECRISELLAGLQGHFQEVKGMNACDGATLCRAEFRA